MSLQSLLGIELPLLQAPMAGAQGSALAIAVSNAGGLGALPCAMLDSRTLLAELDAIKAQTSKPWNLNFFCHQQPIADPASDARWREALAPYYLELEINPSTVASTTSRTPFNNEIADLLEAYRPPVVSFHFGLPSTALLNRVRSWGSRVLCTATTVDEARWLESKGVDAVIAQGLEAGGHRGNFLTDTLDSQLPTSALLMQIVRAVRLPVIAAGGIVDRAGVRAALQLGASAVQVGTAYLLCDEAKTSAVHRAALQGDAAHDTALTNVFTGRPARGIVNRLMRELGPISPLAPAFPLASGAITPLRACAEQQGSGDFSPLWAGQNVRGCRAISAAAMTRQLAP